MTDVQTSQKSSNPDTVKCSTCNIDMEVIMDVPFRIGGSSGGWKLLFGEWAELGEDMLSFDLYICHQCGRVQFFADKKTRETLRVD